MIKLKGVQMSRTFIVFLTNNLDLLIILNVAISVIWVEIKKKNTLSKKDYWQTHKSQIWMWTPTILLSLFLNFNSVNTTVYTSLYITSLLIFYSLHDFYKKFDTAVK